MGANAPDPSGEPRARIWPPKPDSVIERVDYIASLMRTLEWESRFSRELALAWGLSESAVHHDAAEAHRVILREISPDVASRETGLALQRVLKEALEAKDRKNVIRAAEVWSTISGAAAPQKHEHRVGELTPQKAREAMAQLFGSVTPEQTEE